jgi:hypothetical protein
MQDMKDCPYCAETIRGDARICKHCHSNLAGPPAGKFVRVRVKVRDRFYKGNLFVPLHLNRVSDTINDERQFVILVDTKEEAKLADIQVGFIALNKNSVEWVQLIKEGAEVDEENPSAQELY